MTLPAYWPIRIESLLWLKSLYINYSIFMKMEWNFYFLPSFMFSFTLLSLTFSFKLLSFTLLSPIFSFTLLRFTLLSSMSSFTLLISIFSFTLLSLTLLEFTYLGLVLLSFTFLSYKILKNLRQRHPQTSHSHKYPELASRNLWKRTKPQLYYFHL